MCDVTGLVRLLDVFYIGPIDILVSSYVDNKILKYFTLLIGIANILYAGHNFLYLNAKLIKTPWKIYRPFLHKDGKTQILRLYNLLLMYPILIYIYNTTIMPRWLRILFLLNIVSGFIYNLFYLITT